VQIPEGFVDKARFVKVIFTDVQKEYDALLHILTLGLDWTWRRRMISRVVCNRPLRVLDLACGTGLVTFALCRRIGSRGLVVGLDPSASMLQPATGRKRSSGGAPEFVRAVGEFMPFRDEVFDYETVGLALRNFGDKAAMFGEAQRTLTSSGCFLSVDFVVPDKPLIRKLYMFHVFNILPAVGRIVSENWQRTLAYLAKSIQISVPPPEICKMLREQGFRRASFHKITLGVVALVEGRK
jgi:demethylmenaquinone methyltransferase/2-methoxy-6-polyprenyl-1,4-benzoquinol methylase